MSAFLILSAAGSLSSFAAYLEYASQLGVVVPVVFAALITASGVYSVYKGVEGLSRAAFLLAVLLGLTAAFVLLSNIPSFEPELLNPLEIDFGKPEPLLREILRIGLCPEILLYVALKRKVSTAKECSFESLPAFFAAQAALFALFAVACEGVFGEMEALLPYPLLSLTSVAQLSVVRRLDALFTGVFTVICAFRCAAFTLGALVLLKIRFEGAGPAVGMGLALLTLAMALEGDSVLSSGILAASFLTATAALLISFLIVPKLKREKETLEE
ncbi:MAG: GerAB/ArcD/ProY family transporter [Oscillospiraceae bacterium]|nr:GerAB/ArcD/ProY family transporter [Oscillospiraceae bacterium]